MNETEWTDYLCGVYEKDPGLDNFDGAVRGAFYINDAGIYFEVRRHQGKILFCDGKYGCRISLPDFAFIFPPRSPMEGDAEAIIAYVQHLIERDMHDGGTQLVEFQIGKARRWYKKNNTTKEGEQT